MKLKNYRFLVVFVISITFLLIRPSAIGQTQCRERQTQEEIEGLIEIKGPTVEDPDGEKVRALAEKIHRDYQDLCTLFEAGEKGFEKEMAKIIGSKTSIKTHEGEFIRGIGGLKKFFLKRKKVDRYDRVELELNEAYVFYEGKRVLWTLRYDYIVYKSFTIHWIRQAKGKIIKNQDDEGEGSDEHSLGCRWGGR